MGFGHQREIRILIHTHQVFSYWLWLRSRSYWWGLICFERV